MAVSPFFRYERTLVQNSYFFDLEFFEWKEVSAVIDLWRTLPILGQFFVISECWFLVFWL
jgi:hypothetical protein